MSKIKFVYGAMNSGKSLELIKVAHNYRERDMDVIVLKPRIDDRTEQTIYSRAGAEIVCDYVEDFIRTSKNRDDLFSYECILIDESNFLTYDQVNSIVDIAFDNGINVIFYGLLLDFTGHMFEGSKRIVELADKLEENTGVCWCGSKTRKTARFVDDEMMTDGDTIVVDNEKSKVEYIPLCNKHYRLGQV